jgi:putative DNA primase/helicase
MIESTKTATAPLLRVVLEPDRVPRELQSFDHWIVHRDKEPFDPRTGERASTRDSRTWGAFEEAVAAYTHGGWDGVGFVFSSGDPYTGIDLDGVRDPDTGDLEPWAAQLIKASGGYAEVSPSGRGVHLYLKGDVPSRKGSGIEVYSTKRYFRVTGVCP